MSNNLGNNVATISNQVDQQQIFQYKDDTPQGSESDNSTLNIEGNTNSGIDSTTPHEADIGNSSSEELGDYIEEANTDPAIALGIIQQQNSSSEELGKFLKFIPNLLKNFKMSEVAPVSTG